MKTSDQLGEELKSVREAAHLSLKDVEEKTSISNAYLSQLEHGKIKKPSANVLFKLARVYKIDFGHLLVEAGIIETEGKDEKSILKSVSNAKTTKSSHSLAGYSLSSANINPKEEEALVAYLTFLRSQQKK